MSTDNKYEIPTVIDALGGSSNIKDYFHCATRLRVNLYDFSKINRDVLNNNTYIISVVIASGQCQLIIGNKVNDFYSAMKSYLDQMSTNNQQKNIESIEKIGKKEPIINRLFAFISGSFLPVIGIFAAAGLLRAITTVLQQMDSLSGSETLKIINFISNTPFYFMPVILGFTIARKLKSNELIGAIAGASLLYPEFTAMAGGQLHFLGLPLIVMNYGSSVFPVFFAVPVAAWLEKRFMTLIHSSMQLILVPLLCFIIVIPLTMLLLGPFGAYLGDYLASGIVYIINLSGLLSGIIIGALYSFVVLFGLHWALIPLVFSNFAHGGDPIYAIGGMSAIAQMGVALGIFLRAKDKQTRQLAGSSVFPALISGVTEPILYGLIVPNKRTIPYILIAGAVGGAIIGSNGVKINELVFASLLSIPTAQNVYIYSVALFSTLITGTLLVVLFGYQSKKVS